MESYMHKMEAVKKMKNLVYRNARRADSGHVNTQQTILR